MTVWDSLCQAIKLIFSDQEEGHSEFWPDKRILDHAKRDWIMAYKIFQEADDPELIDYAIYNLKAAEKRYMYLLKQLQAEAPEPSEFARLQSSSGL